MSRLSEYSKFDRIDTDSEGEREDGNGVGDTAGRNRRGQRQTAGADTPAQTPSGARIRKDGATGRYVFEHNGRPIYEFEQTLDDVTIYVTPPPFVQNARQIDCVLTARHLKLGLHGQPHAFIDEDTHGLVDVAESTWSLEDEDDRNLPNRHRIVIYLTKANRGTLWEAALKGTVGAALDPTAAEDVRKQLLLERFHEENPGMDFRGASFNGSVPDPRTFMGGLKYT